VTVLIGDILAHDPARSDAPAQFLAEYRGEPITGDAIRARMSLREYHADPVAGGSLSSTGARRILPPGTPAHFDRDRRLGRVATPEMEFGTAVHSVLFGGDPEVVVLDEKDRRKKDTQETEKANRERGVVTLLQHEHARLLAMVDVVRAHPEAGLLFDQPDAMVEHSLFWRDQDVMHRARPDTMIPTRFGRLVMGDYKSCHAVDDLSLMKAMHEKGWHQQADWYERGAVALGLAASDEIDWVFICQEKTPPYYVRCIRPNPDAMAIARERNNAAIRLYRECTEAGRWPGYPETIDALPLPPWVVNAYNWERW
jgi:hypothetical protein